MLPYEHVEPFLGAYNFAERLKTLKRLTIFEFISEKRTSEPGCFKRYPNHLITKLDI